MILTDYYQFRLAFTDSGLVGIDGHYEWPANMVTGLVKPFTNWSFTLPFVIDLDTGLTDEFHWYLSLPNLGSGQERFVLQYSGLDPVSDTVTLALTAAGTAELVTQDASTMSRMLKNCFIYAKSTNTGDIYVIDLHRSAFNPDSF